MGRVMIGEYYNNNNNVNRTCFSTAPSYVKLRRNAIRYVQFQKVKPFVVEAGSDFTADLW
jgi:hypothetical protein